MKKIIALTAILSMGYVHLQSQDNSSPTSDSLQKEVNLLKKLKITGWVQAQFQLADTAGAKNFDGGDFPSQSDNRFMIRRGRVKFTYNGKNSQYVLQLNATERGINLVEIFAKTTDPWIHSFSLTGGVMNRPFGYEIQQSSADRESPERSRWVQSLMQNERDLGVMATYQPPKTHILNGLKIDAGLFNGTGIAVPGTGIPAGSTAAVGITGVNGLTDFDSYKDFIGRISYYTEIKNTPIKYGLGVSHYNGGFVYQNNKIYDKITTDNSGVKSWSIADTTINSLVGTKAPRRYYGLEGLISLKYSLGTTTIRGEYFTGTQTSRDIDTRSPQALPSISDAMFVRNFDGGYAYFIHRIGHSKHELALKYEWYDPNTDVSAEELIGTNGMKQGEIKYTMLGLGYNLYYSENVKFMFHYNVVSNEVTNISGYKTDLKDNIITIRMQYRF